MLKIHNSNRLAAFDLNVIGAAVKILAAGGSNLDAPEMRKACGCSYHLWVTKGEQIAALVKVMEHDPK